MFLKALCKTCLPALLLLVGCAATAPAGDSAVVRASSQDEASSMQIIVQFKSSTQSATDLSLLQELVDLTGLTWQYLRPMSGGSHVYQLSGGATLDQYNNALAKLNTHPEIEYAELDRIMRPTQQS